MKIEKVSDWIQPLRLYVNAEWCCCWWFGLVNVASQLASMFVCLFIAESTFYDMYVICMNYEYLYYVW